MKHSLRFVLLTSAVALAAPAGYHITNEIKVGGEGGWDYLTVDSGARRLYVSHATKVVVVDLEGGKVAGEIPDTPGVHGIAVAPELNRGFISNGRGNNATIFDLKTLKPISQVATGKNPDAIQYDAVSGRVYTFNGTSKDATAFDAKTGKVEGTLPLGGKPEFSAADGKGKIYVNIEDTSEVVEIDAAKAQVTKRYSLKPCDSPSGLAMDTSKRRIFSVCENEMMVVSDPDTGKVIATPAIGKGADGVAFDPGTRTAFSSNGGDGQMTVVQEQSGKWSAVENATTKKGARTIAVDPKTHNLYLPTAMFGAATPGAKRATALPNTFEVLVVHQ